MSDYAGAKLAIRERLEANWNLTRIAYPNEKPAEPWPPTIANPTAPNVPDLAPWVFLEIVTMPGGGMRGCGLPGNQVWETYGLIIVHVFTPSGGGDGLATQYAVQIGEIFQAQKFYDNGDGCYVRTWAPRVDEGGPATTSSDIEWSNTGNWYRVTMSCPFEYWHIG